MSTWYQIHSWFCSSRVLQGKFTGSGPVFFSVEAVYLWGNGQVLWFPGMTNRTQKGYDLHSYQPRTKGTCRASKRHSTEASTQPSPSTDSTQVSIGSWAVFSASRPLPRLSLICMLSLIIRSEVKQPGSQRPGIFFKGELGGGGEVESRVTLTWNPPVMA